MSIVFYRKKTANIFKCGMERKGKKEEGREGERRKKGEGKRGGRKGEKDEQEMIYKQV